MTAESARYVIVDLVAHGFDRADLESMGHAELRWWRDGLAEYNRDVAMAKRQAMKKKR